MFKNFTKNVFKAQSTTMDATVPNFSECKPVM